MTGRDGGAEIVELGSVPGFVVFDLPGAPLSAGGTRLAPDVSVAEVAVLARSMTYKFAALGERVGGAKAGVRGDPADRAGKAALMARFCAEVRPLTDAGRFLTGPDMGTAEEDFAPLRERRAAPAAMRCGRGGRAVRGRADRVRRRGGRRDGAARRAGGAQGPKGSKGLDGRSVAIEGFGKVGGGVAREVSRRGGRVVAVSTVAGCVADPSGLDVERLLELRRAHGDACVLRYGRPVLPPHQLFTEVNADVLVPGTRPGAIDAPTARSLPPGVRVDRARCERAVHRGGRRRAAPARHRGAARLRVQRGRGNRLPVRGRCDPGPGPGHRRGQDQPSSSGRRSAIQAVRWPERANRPEGSCGAGGATRPGRRSHRASERRRRRRMNAATRALKPACRPGRRLPHAAMSGPSPTARSRRPTWIRSWRRAAGFPRGPRLGAAHLARLPRRPAAGHDPPAPTAAVRRGRAPRPLVTADGLSVPGQLPGGSDEHEDDEGGDEE